MHDFFLGLCWGLMLVFLAVALFMQEVKMCDIVTYDEFRERKVEKYIQLWIYGQYTTEQFTSALVRLGFDTDTIEESLDDYFDT